jgi:puromycin-sensitive aminopeptidase
MPAPKRPSRFRLDPAIRPTEYDLRLEPDLEGGTFRGEVRIELTVARPRRAMTLHAADLEITRATIASDGTARPMRVKRRPNDEAVTLLSPHAAVQRATLTLSFTGKLGSHLRGLYAAAVDGRRYAFTQFEAADARRMFPCFDEPSFKARFQLSVTAREGDAVVSNGAIDREEPLGDGRRTIRFTRTPKLSTYLLALAVGPLESSPVRRLGSTDIRVWYVPGKGHLSEFGLEAAVQSLSRLEEYFGIPYPYGKLDLVAVPDFEAGAMENAGAVFFRETLLLLDPTTASLPERKRAAEVIAHELAHMWYGDLVTMAWWDDLWLNEAFATWMAYKVVDDWKPEWRMWQGYEHDRAGALALDALANTHPIYAPVRSVAEATENFDAITYEKGAAVVRMLEHYLGADAFRAGVRIYMKRHREQNAVAADLWRALEEASGREVSRVARAWIEKPGFPLVSLRREGRAKLRVHQQRFFSDPRVPAARRRAAWPLPLVVKRPGAGGDEVDRFLVDGASRTLALGARRSPSWLYGNAAAGGFYRVRHEPRDHEALVARLAGVLSPVERLALVGDQWAMVRAARATIESFLDVVDGLGAETDYDVLDGLAGPLGLLDDQVVEGELQERFRSWIAGRFGGQLAELGWTASPGETDPVRLRRAALLRLVGSIAEAPAVVGEACARLHAYLADRNTLEPNLADAVVSICARQGSEALYQRYREATASAPTPQERRRFLLNLASFRAPALVERTLGATLGPDVPTQDVTFLYMRLFGNPGGRAAAWRFFTSHWKELRARIPPLMVSRLVESTPALRDARYAREVARFFRAHPVPEATRSLKQALELFRLNADLRRRIVPGIARWLTRRCRGESASLARMATNPASL